MRSTPASRSREAGAGGEPALERGHVVGGYGEYGVPSDLTALAEVLWVHRAPISGPAPRHRVVPEPDVSIALVTRDRPDGGLETRGLYLVGPVRSARIYAPEAGERMVAIRLKPEWCRALVRAHPADHVDAVDDLMDVAPELAAPILGDLGEGPTEAAAFTRLAEAIRDAAHRSRVTPSVDTAHRALELLREAGPGVRIRSAWTAFEESGRTLRRAIRSATGASPKRLLREKRLAAALYHADGSSTPAWSRIALASGYYDQSHLIRDCRDLAGASPARLHRERRMQSRAP